MKLHSGTLLYLIAVALLLTGGVVFLADHLHRLSYVRKASEIRIGDTKEQVIRKMGTPVTEFREKSMLLNRSNPETWVYGNRFSLKNAFSSRPPFFWPVCLRLGPLPEHVAVEFDRQGVVTNIDMPQEK